MLLHILTSLDGGKAGPDGPEQDVAALDEEVAEGLIHIWYSARIHPGLLCRLQPTVEPLVAEVVGQIASRGPGALVEKTWAFPGGSSLRVVLRGEEWRRLGRFLDLPRGLDAERARGIRASIVLAPERVDCRHRWHYKEASPPMRLAKQRFREDGLLLPFGHPRDGFDVPNP